MNNVISYIPYTHSFKKMGSKAAFIKDFLSRFVYHNCCHYLTICNTFSEQLIEKNNNATVRILTNFVSNPPETEQSKTVFDNLSESKVIRLLVAGRVFFRQKGQDTLINALCRIKYSSDIRLDIIVIRRASIPNTIIQGEACIGGGSQIDPPGSRAYYRDSLCQNALHHPGQVPVGVT